MSLTPTCDLFVVCGEPSGDAYAAAIVEALHAKRPELTVAAMGGPALKAAGCEMEQDIDGLAVMGFFPVLARLGEFSRLMKRMAAVIRARRPRTVLTVDYPGFNLRLLRRLAGLRRTGTRFIHVVAPQVWAWKPRRAKRIAHTVDRLLCYFPFEPPLFNRFNAARAEFVGHPGIVHFLNCFQQVCRWSTFPFSIKIVGQFKPVVIFITIHSEITANQ